MQFHPWRGPAIVALFLSPVLAQAPCFEASFGTNLQLTDDSVAQGNQLGFTFPGPGGAVTSIDISSNGFVWLGSNTDSGCCNGDLFSFLNDLPRIAPAWMDLNPSTAGAVWFNTFPATAQTLARAVVTWDQVPEYGTATPTFTIQLQMVSDGSFTFLYDSNVSNQSHNMLMGCTQGGAATANAVDFATITSTAPHVSGTNPTIHEEQNMAFDVGGSSYEFFPLGNGGYLVLDRPSCALAGTRPFGRGCPSPAVAYELFPFTTPIDLSNTAIDFLGGPTSGYTALPSVGFFTGFTNSIASGDDVVTGPFNLPFTFAFPGGSTNAIDVSSNGFIWLSTGNSNARCCYGDPTQFLADPASIAVLWEDLNPGQGGNVYFDVDPNNTEVHITWAAVPEYFNGSPCTAQITLRSDGSFRLSWGTVVNQNHDCLVGFSQGNGALDPGSIDFSASLPFTMGAGGIPVYLRAQAGLRPVLGTNFVMEVGDFPANSAFAIMVMGFSRMLPPIDLASFGMPGCAQHVSIDATRFFGLVGNPAPFSFGVPNDPGLTGVRIQSQVLTLSPGANALGALTSNGLELKFGL